jgi:uncharacterized DUF497 family protein
MALDLSKIEGFEWDKGNLEHIKKHKIDAKECEEAFFNKPRTLSKDEAHSETEERHQLLGVSGKGRLIFLAFTIRNNKIRIVSARDQNKKEKEKLRRAGGEPN